MYVKQLELSKFKSFGGTTPIPLLPGFTVISGPNGSGKSNLLDALLFALGLSGSKGMRAERLPDLVNHSQIRRGHAVAESWVTVTFELPPLSELSEEELAWEREIADESDQSLPTAADIQQATATNGHSPQPLDAGAETKGQVANNGAASDTPNTNGVDPHASREWRVTRKLRVTKGGTYTSTYAINDEPCTLSYLHEQLNRRRIYSEGYNVVLQGDVTGIISMNARQRREIIDELAGVANFDRKISRAKDKLEAVKEQEERFRIVEQELVDQRDRLARDRVKAEKYQKLRAELQHKSSWEGILRWRTLQQQIQQLQQHLIAERETQTQLEVKIATATTEIQQITATLEAQNAKVKALGEEEQLALQSAKAEQEAELRQLQRQQGELEQAHQVTVTAIAQTQQQLEEQQQALTQGTQQQQQQQAQVITLTGQRDQAQQALEHIRAQSQSIAASADAWVQQQAQLHQQIDTLLETLEPHRAEQAQLQERLQLLGRQQQTQEQTIAELGQELADKQSQLAQAQAQAQSQEDRVLSLVEAVTDADQTVSTHKETQTRLQQELQEKQRQLDKLEAKEQAHQEAQGTHATRIIRKANLAGVHGLVAQLARVDPQYQLALEIAAGGRLGHLVVADDTVAAAGIDLLKRERGGRTTFLPLNKMRSPKELPFLSASGAIDYALNLLEFDPRYHSVFAYVLGNTVVFSTLEAARRHLGRYRMVTLDGELLEPSGAMTGGSRSAQQTLHFGAGEAGESAAIVELRQRLQEITDLLVPLQQKLAQAETTQARATQALTTCRQQYRETQLQMEQLQREVEALTTRQKQAHHQLQAYGQEQSQAQERWQTLQVELPRQEAQLAQWRQSLAELEQSQSHSEWQVIRQQIHGQEAVLKEREQALQTAQQQVQALANEHQRLQEKIEQGQHTLTTHQAQHRTQEQQHGENQQQQRQIQTTIAQIQADLAQLEERLADEKQVRDRIEQQLREQNTAHQQFQWQLQKVQESQQQHHTQLQEYQTQLETQAAHLPDPLPEIPVDLTLEQLQQELRSLQSRIQAMEPVNMLAIEEYERTQERLEELTEKLETLTQERTDLLLRIENFTTLRHQAFRQSFDAVNQNFQEIFAELSDGDGHLQLECPEDPFQGGLNLVAHPKGKPVQRLASMSGGEKSLTALSFIFALQRYRPSPFYAFDEVDMFLDGANVEKLSKMIQKQSRQAQFIVVSLRRPMIEASDRTIGVTQARGTHTQVIGMELRTAAQG